MARHEGERWRRSGRSTHQRSRPRSPWPLIRETRRSTSWPVTTPFTRRSSMAGRSTSSAGPRASSPGRPPPRRPRLTPRPARPSCSSRSDGSRWSWSGSTKKSPSSCEHKRSLVEPGHATLSVRRQCELLGLSRSSLYYEPGGEAAEDLRLMRLIDEQYPACPFYGSRRMTVWLNEQGEGVNRKRVQRLMRVMGLEAIYPKPRLSRAGKGHRIYPYLLRGVAG